MMSNKVQKLKFANRYENGKPVFKPEMVDKKESAFKPSYSMPYSFFVAFFSVFFIVLVGSFFYGGFKESGIEGGLLNAAFILIVIVGAFAIVWSNLEKVDSKNINTPEN